MEIFLAFMGLMDDTIIALLSVPVMAIFLVGSMVLACVGVFLLLKDAAGGSKRR